MSASRSTMDDTQMSRASDAAATRKRRSSILKSQRPPRTPFSELEFNVATPTDTTKSRRVSFSRRTGVAEFATNEATTTWKNFYEEHNKSVESSGNDSGSKQVGHLGKRIFDQQFEEVEADFIGIHNTGPNIDVSSSLMNFEHQALECADDLKVPAPQSNFELSAFTNTQTKLFDELAITCGEVTDRIDVNFSNVQTIGNDDLDDIQNDLKQNFQTAFKRQNMSEYIEVDLNMTQAVQHDVDMSITETVYSPIVQNVSKNSSKAEVSNVNFSQKPDDYDDLDEIQRDLHQKFGHDSNMSLKIDSKTKVVTDENAVDKENIVVNPYAPLKETEIFAVNEEADKVLVFDGKRLTLQAENVKEKNPRLKPEHTRKTIVLNLHDDLTNVLDDSNAQSSGLMNVSQLKKSMMLEDMSITEPIEDIKKWTSMYDKDISVTQAVSSNIVSEDMSRTIHCADDAGNMSITQAVPTKIEKRKTIVYGDDEGNMSITRALPTNVFNTNNKRRTIVFNDGDMSMTQAIPVNIIPEKSRQTIVDVGNPSTTQAHPNTLIEKAAISDKLRTIVYEDDAANISVTQAIPSKIIVAVEKSSDRRRTVVFESDTGNLSITQSVPNHIIIENSQGLASQNTKVKTINEFPIVNSDKNKSRTIVFDSDDADISVTQAVSVNQVICALKNENKNQPAKDATGNQAKSDKRRTVAMNNDDADISTTQAVSYSQLICALQNKTENEHLKDAVNNKNNSDVNKRKTVVFENDDADISMTQAVSINQVLCAMRNEKEKQPTEDAVEDQAKPDVNKRKPVVFDNDDADISTTQAVSYNQIICVLQKENKNETTNNTIENQAKSDVNKRRTIVFENDDADISMTQAVSMNQVICALTNEKENQPTNDEAGNQAISDVNRRKTVVFENDDADISMTQALPSNVVECFNLSIKEVTAKIINSSNLFKDNKRRTVVFENDDTDISVTQVVDTKPIVPPNVQDDLDEALNEVLNSKGNGHRSIVYDEENIETSQNHECDTKQAMSQSIRDNVMENMIKKRSLDYEDTIRTIETLPEDVENIKDENIQSKELVKTVDVSMTDVVAGNSDNMDTEDRFDVSFKTEIEKVASELEQSGNQVRVYQAALSVLTDKGDSQSANPIILDDEKLSSSKICDSEIKQNEKMSTETNLNEVQNTEIQNEAESAIEQQVLQNDDLSMSQVSENTTGILSKSVLDELLDMSSSNEDIDDKHQIVQINEPNENVKEKLDGGSISSDGSMFYITDDREGDEAQVKTETDKETLDLKEQTPLQILYKDQDIPPVSVSAQNEKQNVKDAILISNSTHEKISNNDLEKSRSQDSRALTERKFKTANDTNELLDMLSDLTDKTVRKLDASEKNEEEIPEPITVKEQLALEDKSKFYELEPRRHSFVPRRQSIVMSREDLLRNISLAGDALRSRVAFDDEDLEDDSPEENISQKSIRLNHEVVKTLQFDESATEVSIKLTPLKKTAFGETSYMQEHKKSVIPEFMKDTADGIKELMDDLVKPSAGIPFDSSPAQTPSKKASTCSTQIQANLVASSQVDLNVNSDSVLNKISLCDITDNAVNKSVSRAPRSPAKTIMKNASDKSMDVPGTKQVKIASPCKPMELSSRVLIFDPNNPLNNVILTPEESIETHKYNPVRSEDTVCSMKSNSVKSFDKDGTERTSVLYSVPELIHSMQQSGDACFKMEVSDSKASTLSKAVSVDQSTEVVNDVKSIEVNTDIAMKGNQEILDASSSLTLVEDAVQRTVDVNLSIEPTTNVIHPDDGNESNVECKRKSKKRLRDKQNHSAVSSLDVTPKPISKMQKFSDSPKHKGVNQSKKETVTQPRRNGKNPTVQKLTENKVDAIRERVDDQQPIESKVNIKSLTDLERSGQNPAQVFDQSTLSKKTVTQPRRGGNNPAPAITVQKVTKLKVDPTHEASDDVDQVEQSKSSVKPVLTDLDSSEMASSFTSSNGLRDAASVTSPPSSKSSQMDSQPIVDDVVSKVNVKAEIDMMPFMGSRECEWESSSGRTWSFLLLNWRIRLVVELSQRADNAGVLADTPVQKVYVESLPHTNAKNTLAIVTVGFATDTMRHFVDEGCARADGVPTLVRRCAAAARLSLRWAKVMNQARLHLAYSLTTQGLLTVKVANIPIRCIWEVTFQLELVLEGRPWIRASDVRVRRVLACTPPGPARAPPETLMRLPEDWSHAPRTLWGIFKHLKAKTEDEDDALFA